MKKKVIKFKWKKEEENRAENYSNIPIVNLNSEIEIK